jgi:N-acetylmuramoyl-L-alanine amidase
MEIKPVPASPGNYTKGRPNGQVSQIIVHISQGSLASMASWFRNKEANVSAHYGIGQQGEIERYVEEEDTAWHAGVWSVNVSSIGIEHEGKQEKGKPAWQPTNAQYWASVRLSAALCMRYRITPSRATIRPHSEINPGKPLCPGSGFPLDKYIQDVAGEIRKFQEEQALYIPIRLFDPKTNEPVGTGTLIRGTDKVYIKELKG